MFLWAFGNILCNKKKFNVCQKCFRIAVVLIIHVKINFFLVIFEVIFKIQTKSYVFMFFTKFFRNALLNEKIIKFK